MSRSAFDVELRPAAGWLRLVRATAAALACVATAATGHAVAGGALDAAAAWATLTGATAIAWLLSARRVTTGQTVGLLVLCQVVVHLAGPTSDMQMSAGMIGAHLAATAVSALVLARGEALVWELAERLGLRVLLHDLVVEAAPHRCPPSPLMAPGALYDVRLAHSRAERGPPSGS